MSIEIRARFTSSSILALNGHPKYVIAKGCRNKVLVNSLNPSFVHAREGQIANKSERARIMLGNPKKILNYTIRYNKSTFLLATYN